MVEATDADGAEVELADRACFPLPAALWDAVVAEFDLPARELTELDSAIEAYRARFGDRAG